MAVIVWVERHLLSESLDVAVDLEVGIACFAGSSQLVCLFNVGLDNLMDLEYSRMVIENTI